MLLAVATKRQMMIGRSMAMLENCETYLVVVAKLSCCFDRLGSK